MILETLGSTCYAQQSPGNYHLPYFEAYARLHWWFTTSP